MKTITILGNNSGRNEGDNAILGNMLDDFALKNRTDIRFKIPTLSTRYIRNAFGHHPVQPMGMMPWNLALKNMGLPLYRAMTQTDLILVVDNILFDRKFYNPFVNNLNMISRIAPLSQRRGIPLILYNGSIGPIDRPCAVHAARRVVEAMPLVISRDEQTNELLKRLMPNPPRTVMHADCALNTTPPAPSRMEEIIRKEGLFTNPKGTIGMNINAYIDDYSQRGSMDRSHFCRLIAEATDRIIEQLDVDIMYTVSQIMDMRITRETVQLCKHANRIKVVSNQQYNYRELAGLLSRLEVHAGLRTHPLIFCAAVNTPMININAYPKSAGFMKSIGMEDWTLEFADLSVERLVDTITRAHAARDSLREYLEPITKTEKEKARASVDLVLEVLDSLPAK